MNDVVMAALNVELWDIDKLAAYEKNPYTHPRRQVEQIAKSIQAFGFNKAIVVNTDGVIIAGHGGLLAARDLGLPQVPVVRADHLSPDMQDGYRIADNQIATNALLDLTAMDEEVKKLNLAGLEMDLLGFDGEQLAGFLDDGSTLPPIKGSLRERFGVPPFSVLNAREGWWQARKKAWIGLGIKSEEGRAENLLNFSPAAQLQKKDAAMQKLGRYGSIGLNAELIPSYYDKIERGLSRAEIIAEYVESGGITASGTSIFDPVLCELIYRWFTPPGGKILDPFAGGSVRGIVASKLGRWYQGIELRDQQVESNQAQAKAICKEATPLWHVGDGLDAPKICEGSQFDMVFSCPPYVDLETYSDDPRDLSNKPFPEFMPIYREIIASSCSLLKNDRFACFVVGEVRDKKTGNYHNFVGETVRAFQDAGLGFYCEAILVTAVGTLALRTPKHFTAARKLGKSHQNVLIFLKGDAKRAVEAIGEVESGVELEGESTEFGEKMTAEDLPGLAGKI